MALTTRLSRLERVIATAAVPPEQRACKECQSGRKCVPVFRFMSAGQDQHEPAQRRCPACGRDIAQVINIFGVDPDQL